MTSSNALKCVVSDYETTTDEVAPRKPFNMRTFEEQFPRLKIKEQAEFRLEDLRYTRRTMEELLKDIQEQCLDKVKVKEAIEKWIPDFSHPGGYSGVSPELLRWKEMVEKSGKSHRENLFEELGLEE